MKFRRIDVNRDPLFPGVMRGAWISPGDSLPSPPTPMPTSGPTPTPFELVPEMPAPPTDPKQEKKWQAALAIADVVIARLKDDPDFDPSLLHKVVKDLIDGEFDVTDVAAVYFARKALTHG